MKRLRARAALVVVVACAGCGGDPEPPPSPTRPPPVLEWATYREDPGSPGDASSPPGLSPLREYRLALGREGTLRYSVRDSETWEWQEVTGTWSAGPRRTRWTLRIPADAAGGPETEAEMQWLGGSTVTFEGRPPGAFGPRQWLVPVYDFERRVFDGGVSFPVEPEAAPAR